MYKRDPLVHFHTLWVVKFLKEREKIFKALETLVLHLGHFERVLEKKPLRELFRRNP